MTLTKAHVSFLIFALLIGNGMATAQDQASRLAALANEARTTEQHADVARRYRLQADALDKQAAEQEKRAAAMTAHAPGIAHKWPAMAPKATRQAKEQALETRRAARESRELAEQHQRLAVEGLAD